MKKQLLLLSAALLLSTLIFAQIIVEDSINISRERWRDSTFRINKQLVPTGLLLEYSMAPFTSLQYSGGSSVDTIKSGNYILMLHNLLGLSKVNNNASLQLTDSLYVRAVTYYQNTKVIPFITLFKNYNTIRSTALTEGLFTVAPDSVGLLDVPGRTVSPYNTNQLFALAPYISDIEAFDPLAFAFPANLWETGGITGMTVDFGDGAGFRTITAGSTVNVSYATPGSKVVTAQMVSGAQTFTAKCQLHLSRPTVFVTPKYNWKVEEPPVYRNDAEYFGTAIAAKQMIFFTGGISGANAFVETSCDDVFDKPVIVVEGLDPTKALTPAVMRARLNRNAFVSTMLSYGYDFVFVDFNNNSSYIENNAKQLEKVIELVNANKTGNFKSTVIGYSMGGLIARWCLKDMEDRGLQHNVENYISYDAPHQGANIPLGMQYIFSEMLNDMPYLAWFGGDLGGVSNSFSSPAARQMLNMRAVQSGNPFLPYTTSIDPLRTAFAERLKAKGYPQQTHNYGVAFGRGDNVPGNKNAGNGRQFTPGDPFGPGTKIFEGGVTFLLVNFSSQAYALPENNTDYIARYRFYGVTIRRIFGIPLLPSINIKVRNFRISNLYSYDDAPGSYGNTQDQFVTSLNAGDNNGFAGDASYFNHKAHNFIPTVSALDLQNQNYGPAGNYLSTNLYVNVDNQITNTSGITGNTFINAGLSPFEAAITATSNITDVNNDHNGGMSWQVTNFLFRKLLNTLNPNYDCNTTGFCNLTPVINGNYYICSSGGYTATNLPRAITISWRSKYGYFSISGGQGTPFITLNKVADGVDVLELTITNACGISRKFEKEIKVGGTPVTFLPYGPACSFPITLCANPIPGSTYRQWTLQTSGGTTNPSTSSWCINLNSSTLRATLNTDNECGFVSGSQRIYLQPCAFGVSPNPAQNHITITAENNTVSSATKTADNGVVTEPLLIKRIVIYDASGNLRKTIQCSGVNSREELNVGNLNNGFYIVEIQSNQSTVRKNLIIQR
ncbi:pimeloyl-ACP methyl ester carboxylesterase [Filimonas zeae]|uniref:Secretion system C-terminal sorting domain-containing protein n=1 Tax=Filimonas zeae TaxID=1737353 RepID=A0A917MV00_9BACT|nr:T9SS type A sorting domain-containing protein [Filimonas zeae]MDR6338961.1 pimeloyl-ACP methyl ester carboxylesterase [Filimonas zeae]GGH65763.1 hypothetical protein GCM10011379_19250 [Filimonas zeae]